MKIHKGTFSYVGFNGYTMDSSERNGSTNTPDESEDTDTPVNALRVVRFLDDSVLEKLGQDADEEDFEDEDISSEDAVLAKFQGFEIPFPSVGNTVNLSEGVPMDEMREQNNHNDQNESKSGFRPDYIGSYEVVDIEITYHNFKYSEEGMNPPMVVGMIFVKETEQTEHQIIIDKRSGE